VDYELRLMMSDSATGGEDEYSLVERARTGDPDAFGELVRRHRKKAYGWAQSAVHDPHLAEDIVQEALMKAFLHIGGLMDSQRFTAWLARIVRNQAYMKLRRGGLYAKEKPFTGVIGDRDGAMYVPEGDRDYWGSIDKILFQLNHTATLRDTHEQDPAQTILRREWLEGIMSLLDCLNARERRMFEAYFFDQISIKDIALLLNTSTASVHNYISKARKKVQQERYHVHISMYVKKRFESGRPKIKLLEPPSVFLYY